MTSHELAKQLLAGPDMPVHIRYQYGDYWRTIAAPQVTSVKEGEIIDNPNNNMPRVVTQDDFERDELDGNTHEDKYNTVILIG